MLQPSALEFLKEARVFGAQEPQPSAHALHFAPKEHLKARESYVASKAKEKPTSKTKAALSGAATGAGVGALTGAIGASRKRRGLAALGGAAVGAGAGAVGGLLARHADKSAIREAKKVSKMSSKQRQSYHRLKSVGQLEKQDMHKRWEEGRRHQQLLRATTGGR